MTDGDVGELPREFGDYTLLRTLGRGGMGQVYLAKIKSRGLAGVDKLCVVKTLRVSNDPEYQRRFVDEARLIVLLTHRNICHVFDAGCFEDQYYLAMEHIHGRELRSVQKLAEEQAVPLSADVTIFIIKEVLEALDAAHRMTHPLTGAPLRVVHRDVSPQNVMISSEGEVKLIDFGLAESSQKVERTAPRIVMGKIAYMAPEQARGDPGLDGRADQFAAGVMLYELLSNARYYGDLPFDDVWRNSGRGGFVPTLLKNIEPALAAVITKSTAPNRNDRYASCGDMRAALQKVELQRGVLAGSRETREAFHTLMNRAGDVLAPVSSPEMPAMLKPPPASAPQRAPDATIEVAQPKEQTREHKERTRTFRVRSIQSSDVPTSVQNLAPTEKTEIGFVIEGLEPAELPPALSTGDAFRPVSLLGAGSVASAAAMPAPTPQTRPGISVEESAPREPTMLVRSRPKTPSPDDPPTLTTAVRTPDVDDDLERPRRFSPPLIAAAVAGVLVIIAAVVAFAGHDGGPAVVDAGVVVASTEDAGVAAVVVDAGAVVVAVADAGSVVVAVADAGVPDLAAFDTDAGTTTTSTPKTPKTPRKKRDLPPLPTDSALGRIQFLRNHCGDLKCVDQVEAAISNTNVSPDTVNHKQLACYEQCKNTPRR